MTKGKGAGQDTLYFSENRMYLLLPRAEKLSLMFSIGLTWGIRFLAIRQEVVKNFKNDLQTRQLDQRPVILMYPRCLYVCSILQNRGKKERITRAYFAAKQQSGRLHDGLTAESIYLYTL